MLHNFNPILYLNLSHPKTSSYIPYLASKEIELSGLENLLDYSKNKLEGKSHSSFISNYILLLNNHIETIKSTMDSLPLLTQQLLKTIKDNINLVDETFELNGFKYYAWFEFESYFFFTSLGYDNFLEQDSYAIFEIKETSRGFSLIQVALGFTNQNLNDLRKHPSYLKKQIEKFDSLSSHGQLKEHLEYCYKLLQNYFNVKAKGELYNVQDGILTKILGKPLELLRTVRSKYNINTVKISLPNSLKENLTPTLIELILNEKSIDSKDEFKDILDDIGEFEEYCNRLEHTKTELMSKLSISQDTLDKYMSYLPDDF